ncbi:MAG: alpha-amylase family glycosyl hydrolase [Phototrophicales bacterium]|nr:alpha-amylase family glycosyl hydrolase [Phototrophicales bacterium]
MEFIFGTLATPELRQLHHQIARLGVQHGHEILPLIPKPDSVTTLFVTVGHDFPARHVACYYTTDGSIPVGNLGVAQNGTVVLFGLTDYQWDSITWGYHTHWTAQIPPQPENTIVRYRISAWAGDDTEAFADYPELKATTERAAGAFFRGEPVPPLPPIGNGTGTTFTFHVSDSPAPAWAKSAVIYQIFVDRFYAGDGQNWIQTSDLRQPFGGTLWGVRDKLDYLADLGITCIWLTPTFVSPSHHGYDTSDYFKTEARLGGDEALRAVVESAHQRGIRVVLDLACNHVSSQNAYFLDALNNPNSAYRDWFVFDDSPEGYKTFFGSKAMPYLNLQYPPAREWICSVAQYWLKEFDVDGYRLDHANGPGADFWSDFRVACRAIKPDAFCFGEVVEAPNILRTYAGGLDGILDFHMEDMLRKVYAKNEATEAQFHAFLERHYAYFPENFIMPTFLDNHDMNRFLFVVDGDKSKLMRAAEAQFALPHPPIIYYGTEVAMTQNVATYEGVGLDESRLPMVWGANQDAELLAFYKVLIAKRRG